MGNILQTYTNIRIRYVWNKITNVPWYIYWLKFLPKFLNLDAEIFITLFWDRFAIITQSFLHFYNELKLGLVSTTVEEKLILKLNVYGFDVKIYMIFNL